MSYFYIKPVLGDISLHLLEECVLKRWQYFKENLDATSSSCQYVIEGSAYDNIGHFMLNFLSNFSSDKNLISVVTLAEESLFFKRIQCASSNDLRLLCKNILKVMKEVQSGFPPFFDVLEKVCKKLVIKHIAQHVSQESHNKSCSVYVMDSHFSLCLPLVATRQIEIKNGFAIIPCGKWKMFFRILFRLHLNFRNKNIRLNVASKMDPRWRELVAKLTQSAAYGGSNCNNIIKHTDVDEKSKYFPPCMKHLHSMLRTKHRLSHNERFRFSLYLKDIGMPMQQSILFWQKEYKKPCHQKSFCTHEWDKDANKYTYGIRHLYGLEGSRKNYSMVSCATIQERASAEGGCPFKHFDEQHLKKSIDLDIAKDHIWNDIVNSVKLKKHTEACNLYKNAVISQIREKKSLTTPYPSAVTLTPVNYFHEINSLI